jgi:hypothetical protein
MSPALLNPFTYPPDNSFVTRRCIHNSWCLWAPPPPV